MAAVDSDVLRLQLIDQLLRVPAEQLVEVERLLRALSRPVPVLRVSKSGPVPVAQRD